MPVTYQKSIKYLLVSRRNLNIFPVDSFKIVFKYPIVIASKFMHFFAIMTTYTYVCFLLKVMKTIYRLRILYILTDIVT